MGTDPSLIRPTRRRLPEGGALVAVCVDGTTSAGGGTVALLNLGISA